MSHLKAYRRGMTGPDYVWMVPMWYNDNWWRSSSYSSSNNYPSCTDEAMLEVVNGIIGWVPYGYSTLQDETIVTLSGLVSVHQSLVYFIHSYF